MKKIVLAASAAALAALPLAGCTDQQVAASVYAACVAAGVGAQVGVIVTSSIGGSTAQTGGTIGNDVQQSCQVITGATSAVVGQINAAGGTAKLNITVRTPRLGLVRRVVVVQPRSPFGVLSPIVGGFLP